MEKTFDGEVEQPNNTLILKKEGNPTIFLWGSNKEKEFIKEYTQNAQIQQEYVGLMNSVYNSVSSILQTKELEIEDIETIKKSFFHKSKLVNEAAGKHIIQLTHYSPIFANLLNELSCSKQSNIRLRVVQSLWSEFPPHKQANEILINALNDCSKRVRLFAVQRIMFYNLNDLLPNLKEKICNEPEIEIKQLMMSAVNLFENGYYTQEFNQDKISVYFLYGKGNMKSFLLNKLNLTEKQIKLEIEKRKTVQ
jgi:hypothetical protein